MGEIVLVLLAVGDSRWFNGNKLLHLFGEESMYRYLVDEVGKLPEALLEKKIVVTQHQEVMNALDEGGYLTVENHESELGISHSIELETRVVEAWGDYRFRFMVCDQPYLKGGMVRTLVDGFLRSDKDIGCLSCQGELGNPTVFSNRYRKESLALEGGMGSRRIIRHHSDNLFLCEVEDRRRLVGVDVKKG